MFNKFFQKFFQKQPTPTVTTSHIYTHLVGYQWIVLTQEEKIAIANSAKLMARVFADKLVVVSSKQYDGTQEEYLKQQGRILQLEEVIHYLNTFEKKMEEKTVEPISRGLF